MSRALSGLRVLDLSDSVAGQFGCRMLADFGAKVILIEPPSGSVIRTMPPFDPAEDGLGSLLFFHLASERAGRATRALPRGPLMGLRVLDFTTAWAGPMTRTAI